MHVTVPKRQYIILTRATKLRSSLKAQGVRISIGKRARVQATHHTVFGDLLGLKVSGNKLWVTGIVQDRNAGYLQGSSLLLFPSLNSMMHMPPFRGCCRFTSYLKKRFCGGRGGGVPAACPKNSL